MLLLDFMTLFLKFFRFQIFYMVQTNNVIKCVVVRSIFLIYWIKEDKMFYDKY